MRFSGAGLGWFGLILALLGYSKRVAAADNGSSTPASSSLPPSQSPPILPVSLPAPWPQAIPRDLPPFPSGWQYDEPPPPEVQQRAGQLVSPLWNKGAGSYQTEQTAGRWITYRAEKMRSGHRGIVAYRLKTRRLAPAPRVSVLRAPTAAMPAPSPAMPVPELEQRSPGLPQPTGYVQSSWRAAPGGAIDTKSPLTLPTLRVGMGMPPGAPVADVRVLQDRLGITPDGRFGKVTLAAVRTFQGRNGLASDGIVGPRTWSALFAVRA